MTTHPADDDLAKRLRDVGLTCTSKAADRIEQLEAALTCANAATAAAFEVVSKQLAASRETFCYASPGSDEEFTSLLLGFDTAAGIIRSLATPDQTAALDRLIAEAVGPYVDALHQIADQTDGVTPEPDNLQMAIGSINSYVRAILALIGEKK